ncbi:ABC transporter permease [Parapusillimonas sp. JC17]|uniref:ABC transporter permease n=1 Tax=Parapusillimonas sp. JC17 TaxID=3445768 RepID=UPI003F9FC417
MLAYLARRIAQTIPTLLLVALAVFALLRLIPGDPAQLMLGDGADAESLARLREQMGLTGSLPTQFMRWLAAVLRGDFGHSLSDGQPVLPVIIERFQVSATIVVVAVAIAVCIAVPAGLVAAWKQNKALDVGIVMTATLLLSIPSFWLGMLLLLLFGLHLNWLPVVGYMALTDSFSQGILYVILPIATLAMVETGVFTRMSRASAIEVLRLEYVAHARAKGVPESSVLRRHVLPNAFAPTLTLIGLMLGNLLGGIAVLETVFTLPGLGRHLVDAIFARDYPVIQGCLLFTALIYVCVNLVVDLCYPLFDPRVTAQ